MAELLRIVDEWGEQGARRMELRFLALVHDRPYAIWQRMRRTGKSQEEALEAMLARLPDLPVFLRFVELDSSTEGKNPAPLEWLRGELARRGVRG